MKYHHIYEDTFERRYLEMIAQYFFGILDRIEKIVYKQTYLLEQ